jgi:hypothetical protein
MANFPFNLLFFLILWVHSAQKRATKKIYPKSETQIKISKKWIEEKNQCSFLLFLINNEAIFQKDIIYDKQIITMKVGVEISKWFLFLKFSICCCCCPSSAYSKNKWKLTICHSYKSNFIVLVSCFVLLIMSTISREPLVIFLNTQQ